MKTDIEKVDDMFAYGSKSIEEAKKFVKRIEGTDAFWHLIGTLIIRGTEDRIEIELLQDKIRELENINENISNCFKNRNEYGY